MSREGTSTWSSAVTLVVVLVILLLGAAAFLVLGGRRLTPAATPMKPAVEATFHGAKGSRGLELAAVRPVAPGEIAARTIRFADVDYAVTASDRFFVAQADVVFDPSIGYSVATTIDASELARYDAFTAPLGGQLLAMIVDGKVLSVARVIGKLPARGIVNGRPGHEWSRAEAIAIADASCR